MIPSLQGTGARAMLQDLRSNRRVQGALAALALMVWYLWPSAPARPARPGRSAPAALGDRQSGELRKLPALSLLARAGELPTEERLGRDLFLFEAPPPPPPPPRPAPPPPPPTEAELEARRLAGERAQAAAARPSGLRYLGYLATPSSGRLGAFMKGEEPCAYAPGALVNPQWRLRDVTDAAAVFENVRFADLRHRIEAVEARAAQGRGASNEF